jgi:hypothetical protein
MKKSRETQRLASKWAQALNFWWIELKLFRQSEKKGKKKISTSIFLLMSVTIPDTDSSIENCSEAPISMPISGSK